MAHQLFTNTHYSKACQHGFLCDFHRTKSQVPGQKEKSLACTDLRYLKEKARGEFYPKLHGPNRCFLMFFSNLADPFWVNVGCHKKHLLHIFCERHKLSARVQKLKDQTQNMQGCPSQDILHSEKCLKFSWFSGNATKNTMLGFVCREQGWLPMSLSNISFLHYLFDAISTLFPPLLSENQKNMIVMFTHRKYHKIYHHFQHTSSIEKAQGFHVCWKQSSQDRIGSVFFACVNGGYVSDTHVCDGITDCPNDVSDEQLCSCSDSDGKTLNASLACKEVLNRQSNKSTCGSLYFMSNDGKCDMFFMKSNPNISNAIQLKQEDMFQCINEAEIDITLKDDLIVDCAGDEIILPKLLSLHLGPLDCEMPHQLHCYEGHPRCFVTSDICVYKLKSAKILYPCRNGGHLINCEHFQCNKMFKCLDSYCILWSFVCDGKWDCPSGDDESYTHICGDGKVCVNMYKCKMPTTTCIHTASVCNNQADCPSGDDEVFCELADTSCPSGCNCLLFATICMNSSAIHQVAGHPSLSLTAVSLELPSLGVFQKSCDLLVLRIIEGNTFQVCKEPLPDKLRLFDMKSNKLSSVVSGCFQSHKYLKLILLEQNEVRFAESGSFGDLPSLQFLSLSENPLHNFPNQLLTNCSHFQVLSLENVGRVQIDVNAFDEMSLRLIKTDDYHFCCIAPVLAQCTAPLPWHVSCSHLLPDGTIRTQYLSVTITVFILNAACLTLYILSRKSNLALSVNVIFINFNNIICGLYLALTWIADFVLGETFLVKEEMWRSSTLCFSTFGSVLLFETAEELLLFFLSLSRLMVVIQPVDTQFKRAKFVAKYLLLILKVSLSFSVVFTSVTQETTHTLPTSFRFPFVDPTNSIVMLKIATWFLIITQTMSSLIIMFLHTWLVQRLFESQLNITKSTKADDKNTVLVVQLVVVTVSNMVSWFSVNGIFVATMYLDRYPPLLVPWTIVCGLPANSLFNTSVFIVTSLRKYWKEWRKAQR